MAVGIMILPAAAARFWSANIAGLMICAAIVAFLSSLIGLLLSYHYSLPSGPAIILVAGGFYGASLVLGSEGGLLVRSLLRQKFN